MNNTASYLDIDVDKIIDKLLDCRDKKKDTIKPVNLTENEIKSLCLKAREIFMQQPILIELEAPIKICGMLYIPFFRFIILTS